MAIKNPPCALCKKKNPGRFCRHPAATEGTVPYWHCWSCLKPGEAKGEDKATATQQAMGAVIKPSALSKTPASMVVQDVGPDISKVSQGSIEAARQEIDGMVGPLDSPIQALTLLDVPHLSIAECQHHYLQADQMLGQVQRVKRAWADRMERIIRPIRKGLDEIYSLNRDGAKPLDERETYIKTVMKSLKLRENRLIAEAEAIKREEEDRLRREAEEKARKAQTAQTPQMAGRLAAQATRLEQQAETVAAIDTPLAVRGMASSSAAIKVARVVDLPSFLLGVAEGTIPESVLEIKPGVIQRLYTQDPRTVAGWPGLVIEDDIAIRGRG